MVTPSKEYPKRRPYKALVLFCIVALLTFGFVYDYSYESAFQSVQFASLKLLSMFDATSSNIGRNDEPLIYIYNRLFDSKDWYSYWRKVDGSSDVRTLGNCAVKCQFTFDKRLMKSADFVLVSIAQYKYFGGRSV